MLTLYKNSGTILIYGNNVAFYIEENGGNPKFMKKLVISLLIFTIIFTTVFSITPISVGAAKREVNETPSVATGADETKVGNTNGNNPGKGTYPAEEGWIGVSSWDQLKSKLVAGAKIYLTGNISVPVNGNYNAQSASGKHDGGKLNGTVIDGNGYTITAKDSLFQHTNNTTFQNLTLISELGNVTDGGVRSPLAVWDNYGSITVKNVTVRMSANISCTSSNRLVSGLVFYARSGSEFENVAVHVDLTTDDSIVQGVYCAGGIAARANGASFTNCVTTGTIKINGNVFDNITGDDNKYGGVAGLVGQATAVTFEDCTNAIDIEVTAPGNSRSRSIGGLVGFVSSVNPFTNCVNKGNITVTYTNEDVAVTEASGNVTDTKVQRTGGLLGYIGAATVTMTNCENRGNVTVSATASGSVTAPDDNQTKASYKLTSYAGGVVGSDGSGTTTLTNVWNSGNVSLTNDISGITVKGKNVSKAHEGYAGGLFGCAEKGLNTTVNSETVGFTVKNTGTVTSNYYAGGVVGGITTQDTTTVPNFINCLNDGEIICNGVAAGGIIGSTKEGVNIEDSVNNGKIVFSSATPGSVTSIGGMIGDANVSAGNVADTYLTTISYCVNNGELVSSDTSSGANEHFGGIVGRLANPAPYRITYCINNGDITAAAHDSSYVGGLVGRYQGYGCEGATTADMAYCVNTGALTAAYAGGLFGRTNIGGDGNTKAYVLNFDARYCVNAGTITAYMGGGFVAYHDGDSATKTINYDFDHCVNVGTIDVGGTASGGICKTTNTTVAMDNCLISGEFIGTGEKHILAPGIVVTGNGNYYNSNIVVEDGNANGAEPKANDEINALVRSAGAPIFSRANAEWLYKATGSEALSPYVVLDFANEENKAAYFGTQAALDAVYDVVYANYYGSAESTSYTVTISPNIKLMEDGGSVTLDFDHPSDQSRLTITVVQPNNSAENFKLTSDSGVLEFWFVQDGRVVKNGDNLFEFDHTDSGNHKFGAVIKDEASLYPDTYTGYVTFNIDLK